MRSYNFQEGSFSDSDTTIGACVCVCVCVLSCFSCVRLFATQWTIAHQAPLSMVFSRQENWSGLPCPPPGDLTDPGIKPATLCLLHWQVGSLPLMPPGAVMATVSYLMPQKVKYIVQVRKQ